MPKKILVIDDEQMILNAIKVILEDMGYEVATFQDSSEGAEEAKKKDFDLIIVDLRMPGKTGDVITREIIDKKPDAKILILTGYPMDPLAKKALEAGAVSLVKKPFEIGKLLDFLK